jgi:arginase
VALVYVDGGQDLQLPPEHPDEPILDSMGVAHLLDPPGTWEPLAGIGHRRPLLAPDRLVFFGYSDDKEDTHNLVPAVRIPAFEVLAGPEQAARRALAAVGDSPFVLHPDVDVLDFLALPVADIPTLQAMTCVEANPDHADEAGLRAVSGLLAGALAAA